MSTSILGAIALDPGWAVVVCSLLIAAIVIWTGRRRERLAGTLEMIRQLQETESRRARFEARRIMETPAAREGRFESLEPEARSLLSSVASTYALAGILMRRGKLDARLFLELYGASLIQNYEQLAPFRRWRRERFGGEGGSSWEHFEYAYRTAQRRLGRG